MDTVESFLNAKEKYRILAENLPDIVYWADKEGRLLYLSNRARRCGARVGELVPDVLSRCVVPEERERVIAAFQSKLSGEESGPTGFRLADLDGNIRWYEEVNEVIRGADGAVEGITGVLRDRTDQKKVEQALRESEERFSKTFSASPVAMIVTTIDEGRLLAANDEFLRLRELTREQVIGRLTTEIGLWADVSDRKQVVDLVRTNRGVRQLPFRQKTDSGRILDLLLSIELITVEGQECLLVAIFDETNQIRLNKELRNSERRYRALAETSPDFIFIIDPQDNVTYVNQSGLSLLGLSKDQVIGGGRHGFFPAEIAKRQKGNLEIVFRERRTLRVENWHDLPTGSICLDTQLVPLVNDSGTVEAVLGISRDITERRRAEEDRRKLEAQVQQAQKFESLGVLTGGIAHDFNNLLTPIVGNADLALQLLPVNSACRQAIQQIKTASLCAADLCKQMLAYAGKGPLSLESIDLSRFIDVMWPMIEISTSKKVQVKTRFPESLPTIEADSSQIRQVILNLLINASESIEEREGVITLTTGSVETGAPFADREYAGEPPSGRPYVFVEVKDSGCGMSAETLSKVFDPFYSTKFLGRGLGLAVVLGIVRSHGGFLIVESAPGRGTTFQIFFPAADRSTSSEESSNDTRSEPFARTILVVDDERMVLNLARSMSEFCGWRAITATNGREAVELFTRRTNEIHCVVLDLTMPGMDGEETLAELRRIRADIPVILASGYRVEEIKKRFAGKGLAAYIQKPYELTTFTSTLKAILEH